MNEQKPSDPANSSTPTLSAADVVGLLNQTLAEYAQRGIHLPEDLVASLAHLDPASLTPVDDDNDDDVYICQNHPDEPLPEFSSARLHGLLDELLSVYEAKGQPVSQTLLPPLTEAEIRAQCTWFPGEINAEIISLYTWRGGSSVETWDAEFPFWFRDNVFCSLETAALQYSQMMECYSNFPGCKEMIKYAFPIAEFNGGRYVIPTRGHPFHESLHAPIVSVCDGVDVYYYSLEKMVETCIDWAQQKGTKIKEDFFILDQALEMKIWLKHNPNLFDQ